MITWQSVIFRLDPHLQYLTDLTTRMQSWATSEFIERKVGETVGQVVMRPYDDSPDTSSNDSRDLGGVDETNRFVKWALYYPQLLTDKEKTIWKIVRENKIFWSNGEMPAKDASSYIMNNRVVFVTIKKHWDEINLIADGEKEVDSSPIYNSDVRLNTRP